MGAGRSGSTMLDTILGNHPDVESVGELCSVCEQGWVSVRYCACGQQSSACPFWSDVRREWARLSGPGAEQRYSELMRAIEKRRWWLPGLAGELRRKTPRVREYAERTKALYAAIRTVSGKPVVVDSSKRAARAFLLSRIPGIDLRVIHLVRDIRGVAWSIGKSFKQDNERGVPEGATKAKSAWFANAVWVAANLQAEWVRRRMSRRQSIRVRYEDYVTRLEHIAARIGSLVDLDLSGVAEAVRDGRILNVGHTVAGNRMRAQKRVRLRADTEWIERLPAWNRRFCWAAAGWLMSYYGYQMRSERAMPAADQTLSLTETGSLIETGSHGRCQREKAA